jgi:hypothetical protein
MPDKERNANLFSSIGRRRFLTGSAAVALGTLASESLLAAGFNASQAATLSTEQSDTRRIVGALFNPYYRSRDWNFLRGLPEGMPSLGMYNSKNVGTVMAQMEHAKLMGLDFFLVWYTPTSQSRNEFVDHVFNVAERRNFPVALCADIDGLSDERVMVDALRKCAQFFNRPCYLKTSRGNPVIALIPPRTGRFAANAGLAQELKEAAILSINPEFRWKPITATDHRMVKQANEQNVYLGFSVAHRKSIPEIKMLEIASSNSQESIEAWIVSPARMAGTPSKLSFPQLKPSGAAEQYLILDSFNNWATSVPLEPSSNFGDGYELQTAAWVRSILLQQSGIV